MCRKCGKNLEFLNMLDRCGKSRRRKWNRLRLLEELGATIKKMKE